MNLNAGNDNPNSEEAWTVEEFCRRFKIGRTSFYEEVKEGRLKAKKNGTRTLVPCDEGRRWFADLPTMPSQHVAA